MKHFDITIVGAGPIGTCLALALQHLPLHIALIEAKPPRTFLQDRPITLTFPSIQLLKKLRVWEDLALKTTPIHTIHVSEHGRIGHICLYAKEVGLEVFGGVVSFQALTQVLWDKATQLKNVTLFCPAEVTKINRKTPTIQLTLKQPESCESITTELVVAADGTYSTIRNLLGIAAETHDYHTHALATEVEVDNIMPGVAFERFLHNQVLALLPCALNHYGVVWEVSTEQLQTLQALPEKPFIEKLQTAFGYTLGRFSHVTERGNYPLKRVLAHETVRPGFVLLGNALHTLHPIAAQGFNLGLRNMIVLVETIEHALRQKQNFGSFPLLQGYANQIAGSIRNTRWFVDALQEISLRRLTMGALSLFPSAKKHLCQFGLGML